MPRHRRECTLYLSRLSLTRCLQGQAETFKGLYFSSTAEEPVPVLVRTLFPPIETALAKRFPIFENILGTATAIHECIVRVKDETTKNKEYYFLIAYQARPRSLANPSFDKLFPDCQVGGELVVVRSGKTILVQDMAGRVAAQAAKKAVLK